MLLLAEFVFFNFFLCLALLGGSRRWSYFVAGNCGNEGTELSFAKSATRCAKRYAWPRKLQGFGSAACLLETQELVTSGAPCFHYQCNTSVEHRTVKLF
jgi:hypothetical protein